MEILQKRSDKRLIKKNRLELEAILDKIGPIGRILVLDPDVRYISALFTPLSRISTLEMNSNTGTAYRKIWQDKYSLIITEAIVYPVSDERRQSFLTSGAMPANPGSLTSRIYPDESGSRFFGIELAHDIKTTANPNRDTPVLLLTVVGKEHLAGYLAEKNYRQDQLFAGYLRKGEVLRSTLANEIGEIFRFSPSHQI
jgi:hypothetical protein